MRARSGFGRERAVATGLAIACALGLACGGASPPNPDDPRLPKPFEDASTRRYRASEVYQSLDYLRRAVDEQALQERVFGLAPDYDTHQAAALWFRDQYLYTTDPSPRDGLWYFDSLVRLHDFPQTNAQGRLDAGGMAVAAWVSSQLIALEDHARCEDRTGGRTWLQNWHGQRGKNAERVWKGLPTQDRAVALRVAKQIASVARARPADPQPCATGRVAMRAAMDAGRCYEVDPPDHHRRQYVGGSIARFQHCEGEDYVTFVDDATWATRLAELHPRFWEQLFRDTRAHVESPSAATAPPRP